MSRSRRRAISTSSVLASGSAGPTLTRGIPVRLRGAWIVYLLPRLAYFGQYSRRCPSSVPGRRVSGLVELFRLRQVD
jgi:hypothetical protein